MSIIDPAHRSARGLPAKTKPRRELGTTLSPERRLLQRRDCSAPSRREDRTKILPLADPHQSHFVSFRFVSSFSVLLRAMRAMRAGLALEASSFLSNGPLLIILPSQRSLSRHDFQGVDPTHFLTYRLVALSVRCEGRGPGMSPTALSSTKESPSKSGHSEPTQIFRKPRSPTARHNSRTIPTQPKNTLTTSSELLRSFEQFKVRIHTDLQTYLL